MRTDLREILDGRAEPRRVARVPGQRMVEVELLAEPDAVIVRTWPGGKLYERKYVPEDACSCVDNCGDMTDGRGECRRLPGWNITRTEE